MGLYLLSLFMFLGRSEILEEDGVLILNSNNFDEALESYTYLLVKFYAPWCGHCKSLAPVFTSAAASLSKINSQVRLAKVQVEHSEDLASRYKISSIPSLKFFKKQEVINYNEGRSAQDIIDWVLDNLHTVTHFETLNDLKTYEKSKKSFILYLGQSSNPSLKSFEKASSSFQLFPFVSCSDPAALSEYKVESGSIILLKKFDDKRVDFTGEATQEALVSFVNRNRFPWVMKFDDEATRLVFSGARSALVLFTDKYPIFQDMFEKIASEVKGEFLLAYANLNSDSFAYLEERLGVNATEMPVVMILDTREKLVKFKLELVATPENVKGFVEKWKKGLLKPFYMSEGTPEITHDNDVRKIVANEWELIVMNPLKHVFVLYYLANSTASQTFLKEYEKVASKYRKERHIEICKINMISNELPGFDLSMPALLWYPAKNKTPIQYEGGLMDDDLIEFIEKKIFNREKPKDVNRTPSWSDL